MIKLKNLSFISILFFTQNEKAFVFSAGDALFPLQEGMKTVLQNTMEALFILQNTAPTADKTHQNEPWNDTATVPINKERLNTSGAHVTEQSIATRRGLRQS